MFFSAFNEDSFIKSYESVVSRSSIRYAKRESTSRKFWRFMLNVIIAMLVISLLILVLLFVMSGKVGGIKTDLRIYNVSADSMSPDLKENSLAVVNTKNSIEIGINDIIAFIGSDNHDIPSFARVREKTNENGTITYVISTDDDIKNINNIGDGNVVGRLVTSIAFIGPLTNFLTRGVFVIFILLVASVIARMFLKRHTSKKYDNAFYRNEKAGTGVPLVDLLSVDDAIDGDDIDIGIDFNASKKNDDEITLQSDIAPFEYPDEYYDEFPSLPPLPNDDVIFDPLGLIGDHCELPPINNHHEPDFDGNSGNDNVLDFSGFTPLPESEIITEAEVEIISASGSLEDTSSALLREIDEMLKGFDDT